MIAENCFGSRWLLACNALFTCIAFVAGNSAMKTFRSIAALCSKSRDANTSLDKRMPCNDWDVSFSLPLDFWAVRATWWQSSTILLSGSVSKRAFMILLHSGCIPCSLRNMASLHAESQDILQSAARFCASGAFEVSRRRSHLRSFVIACEVACTWPSSPDNMAA